MITRTIDSTKKAEILFLIPKWNHRYYAYTRHWGIYDTRRVPTITNVHYKGKQYAYTYSFGRCPWWVQLYDTPVYKKIDRKVNKDTGEVLDYNWEEWTD